MEVKKIKEGYELKFNENTIILDPQQVQKDSINILSEIERKINYDKVFNMPGEYEVNGLSIRGFRNDDKVIYLFYTRESSFIYINGEANEEVLNEIKKEYNEIDIALLKNTKNVEKIKNKFNTKVIIYLENAPKSKVEKVKSLKLNLKKLEEKEYLLV